MTGIDVVRLPADAAEQFMLTCSGQTLSVEQNGQTLHRVLIWLTRNSGRRFLTSIDVVRTLRAEIGAAEREFEELSARAVSLLQASQAPAAVVPKSIPPEVRAKLGVYVYALVDPRTGEVFYVGKGKGDRVYQHVSAAIAGLEIDRSDVLGPNDSAATQSAKNARIGEIFQDGFGVEHWILRHAIDAGAAVDAQAFAIEQSLIDLATVSGSPLTNIQGGHVSTEHGLHRAEELVTLYSAEPVPPLPDICALIKVNASSRPDATPDNIYAWARGDWRVGGHRNVPDLPVVVFADDVVRAVHRAERWEQARDPQGRARPNLWRYIGAPDPELEAKYVGKSLRNIKAQRPSGTWRQHGWHPYPLAGSPPAQKATARPSDPRDRYLGCLLGGAIGDALGAPVEFMSRADIVKDFGPAGITRYSALDERIGQITDDTQMTLFTAEGLLRSWVRGSLKGITDIDSVTAHSYLRWLQTQGEQPRQSLMIEDEPGWLIGHQELHRRRAPGNTCLSALGAMRMLGEPARNNSKGCGGVMRVAPAGLFTATLADRDGRAARCWWAQDVDNAPAAAFELGSRLAAITHGHPTGHLTAGVFASMVTSLVSETEMHEAIDVACGILRQQPDHAETLRAITLAVELAETDLPHAEAIAQIGQGWIAEEALAIGIYAALVAAEFEDGVVLAVNHDGDSDSTGAIAGNLLGAQFGKAAIPTHLLEPLELSEVVSEIADDLFEFDQWDVPSSRAIWRKYPGF